MKRDRENPSAAAEVAAGLGVSAKRKAHADAQGQHHVEDRSVEDGPVRRACSVLLAKALLEAGANTGAATAAGAQAEQATSDVAAGIEAALYVLHGSSTSREYKAAGRAMAQNLKRNPHLRTRLIEGQLEPGELVRLDWQQLSTDEQRLKDGKVQAKLMRMATLNDASVSGSGQSNDYTCSNCKGKACDVMDAGRRDIGKCETWGAKGNEDRGRVITCLSCGHRWEVSGLV